MAVARYSLYDFDDSIWIQDTSEANRAFRFLKSGSKVPKIIAKADRTLVANPYLERYAEEAGGKVHIMPTTIDAAMYDAQIVYRTGAELTVGWTGSTTTLKYLVDLMPVLERVLRSGSVQAASGGGQRDAARHEDPRGARAVEQRARGGRPLAHGRGDQPDAGGTVDPGQERPEGDAVHGSGDSRASASATTSRRSSSVVARTGFWRRTTTTGSRHSCVL